ncbi:MAG: DNA repair exonuclease [Lachnospiraceae bacterium]|nr:DNA repair exonuclease [Candidatus Colinaster scatohippi]
MRLIHCADIHLDSKMNANFDKNKAIERRAEILNTFVRMVRYAQKNDVRGILIAGDMFDTSTVSALTRNTVLDTITASPDITFFYLKGNHDRDGFIDSLNELPENLKLFGDEWISYKIRDDSSVIITATELSASNSRTCYESLKLDEDKINIVMMHGQEINSSPGDNAECIDIRALRGKHIDYLALGHIHSFKKIRFDARGVYCYPGCLEGRGFDEPGEHGFVLLEIDEMTKTVKRQFISFASRELHILAVDISGCLTSTQIIECIENKIEEKGMDSKNLVEIVLSGEVDVECEKNIDYIKKHFDGRFFLIRLSDKSKLKINYEEYLHDESLKGEFVRKVMADGSFSEEEKMEVFKLGLSALAGEEIIICD